MKELYTALAAEANDESRTRDKSFTRALAFLNNLRGVRSFLMLVSAKLQGTCTHQQLLQVFHSYKLPLDLSKKDVLLCQIGVTPFFFIQVDYEPVSV